MSGVRLSEIWIYPIKSLGGVSLKEAKVMEKGLQYDRRWMLVDENGLFMSQRTTPQLALFKIKMDGEIKIAYNNEVIQLPELATGDFLKGQVWDDLIEVREVSKTVSQWFSDQLKETCRLVAFPEDNRRLVEGKYSINNENVSLADAFPFLIIGQRTLDDLNERLSQPIPMNRFRPNFVCTGSESHEEDTWRDFSIGNNRFVGVKQCGRCAIPTIDQETAQKGVEPTRTLATYRKIENKIYFGQNLVALDHFTLKVGDNITVQSRTQ